MRAVALSDRGRPVLSVADGVGAVLYKDDPVESLQPPPELQVDFTLNVHEDESSSKANRHHDELGPERPIQHPYGIERGQTHQRCVCNDSMALNNSTILYYLTVTLKQNYFPHGYTGVMGVPTLHYYIIALKAAVNHFLVFF